MTDKIDRAALTGRWVHSHEEDTAQTMVFRPDTFAFPPSRGRKAFQLAPDGSATLSGIGPDDRSLRGPGQWQVDENNRLTLKPVDAGTPSSVLQVLQATPDKLVIKR